MKFRKRPIVIEADQWRKYGDHDAVRHYRSPSIDGGVECYLCQRTMHDHGWIDTVQGGHTVCPGDWIIPEPTGEGFYPCKPDAFEATYEPVDD